jgi:hypothetical protein
MDQPPLPLICANEAVRHVPDVARLLPSGLPRTDPLERLTDPISMDDKNNNRPNKY